MTRHVSLWLLLAVAVLLAAVVPFARADELDDDGGADDLTGDNTADSTKADVSSVFTPPVVDDDGCVFYETFAEGLGKRWVPSKLKEGRWVVGQHEGATNLEGEQGLIVQDKAKHHAIAAKFDSLLDPKDTDIVVQYEVRFHKHLECGGAYLKLVSAESKFDLTSFANDVPYIIMFGPDKCGETDKVHFIFRHKNPVSGKFEEKHLQKPPRVKNDRKTHVYTLVVRTDNTYEIFIDLVSKKKGSLLEDFEPAVNPPKLIDDPEDVKPKDWVDNPKIKDPEAVKPEDWDEDEPMWIDDEDAVMPDDWDEDAPDQVPNPEASKPDDWDDESDGDWEAPLVDNPACEQHGCGPWKRPTKKNPNYKGKWVHPLIDNPAYIGEWKARQIPNPDYFEDDQPHRLTPMQAVGIEIWTMTESIEFDNFYIGKSEQEAFDFAAATYGAKHAYEEAHDSSPTDDDDSEEGAFIKLVNDLSNLVVENPVPAIASLAVGFVTLVFLMIRCCGGDDEPSAPRPRGPATGGPPSASSAAASTAASSASTEEEDDEEDEGETSEPQPPAEQKRAPTATSSSAAPAAPAEAKSKATASAASSAASSSTSSAGEEKKQTTTPAKAKKKAPKAN